MAEKKEISNEEKLAKAEKRVTDLKEKIGKTEAKFGEKIPRTNSGLKR